MYLRVSYGTVHEARSVATVVALVTGRPLRHANLFVKLWCGKVDRDFDLEALRLIGAKELPCWLSVVD